LFVPQASFALFYSVIIPYVFFLICTTKVIISTTKVKFVVLLTFFVVFYVGFKFFIFFNLYDFKELMKIILFATIYFTIREIKINQLERLFFLYITINCIVSLLQFIHFDSTVLDIISRFYSNEIHIKLSLQQGAVRSLGLSPGPGQHGVLSLLMVFFFATLIFYNQSTFSRVLGLLFSVLSLLMSQSKTCLIIFVFVGAIFICFVFVSRGHLIRISLTIFLTTIIFTLIYFSQDLLLIFRDINRLFESGTGVSSMTARLKMWSEMLDTVSDSNIFMILFGAGRSYFEYKQLHHGFFDNDYVYVYVSYGLVGLLTFVITIVYYLFFNVLKYKRMSLINKIIYMTVLAGSLSSLSLDFYFDVKIIPILALLFALRRNELNSNNRFLTKETNCDIIRTC
jgi:hypothetical protein